MKQGNTNINRSIQVESVLKYMQPIIMIIVYYRDEKLHDSWCEFKLDLDSVWVQLKIFL